MLQRPRNAQPTRIVYTALSVEPQGGAGAAPDAPKATAPLRLAIVTVCQFSLADYLPPITLENASVEPDPGGVTPQTHISIKSSEKDEFVPQIWGLARVISLAFIQIQKSVPLL